MLKLEAFTYRVLHLIVAVAHRRCVESLSAHDLTIVSLRRAMTTVSMCIVLPHLREFIMDDNDELDEAALRGYPCCSGEGEGFLGP